MRFFCIPYHLEPLLYDFNTHTQRSTKGVEVGIEEAKALNDTVDQDGTEVLEGWIPRIFPGESA